MIEWNSLSAFFSMGGYGGYVFGALAICFLFVWGELLLLGRAYRHKLQQLRSLKAPLATPRRAVVVHRQGDESADKTVKLPEGEK